LIWAVFGPQATLSINLLTAPLLPAAMAIPLTQVYDALEKRGYKLIHSENFPSQGSLSLPDLVIAIIRQHPERHVINGLPVILHNAEGKEIEELSERSKAESLQNPIGYLYETVSGCIQNSGRRDGVDSLVHGYNFLAPIGKEFIIPRGLKESTLEVLRGKRTKTATKWNVVDYDREVDFASTIEKYIKRATPQTLWEG